jgi:hypothetical protein
MQRFDLVDSRSASSYPGHVIVVAGDDVRTTGELAIRGLIKAKRNRSKLQSITPCWYGKGTHCQLRCRTIWDYGLQGSENLFPGRLSDACRRR